MKINLIRNKASGKFNNLLGLSLFFTAIIFIIFCSSSFNPDYHSYEKLFYNADNYLKNIGQLFFIFNVFSLLNDYVNYDFFRIILAIFQVVIYILIFKKLDFKFKNMTFFIYLPLVSFLILKVHVQIRESIALIGYFYVIIDFCKNKNISLKNIGFFIFSIFIHSGTILIWIPSIIYRFGDFLGKNKKLILSVFFLSVSVFACSTFLRFTLNGQLEALNSMNLNLEEYRMYYSTTLSKGKIIYRLSYFVLFSLIYYEEFLLNSLALKNKFVNKPSYILGYVSLNGLIIFLPSVFILGLFININGTDYNLIYRIVSLLFIFLSFYRSLIYPKRYLTLILNFLIAIDIFRLFFI
jgi:hypothetical protein